ncbi:MAG: AbrB family transcriptional regulator, transcriptional pleiotropic regulator of transition state [Clostridia bacterium]|nr:AbrB family transcriptional regulator, transcriptional pleiotropic regulator of transition state [Clostridia bacterium]
MKATGIVRKIDELGRIVLPMELRKTLDINIKEPMEIFVDEDQIILKKYQPKEACVFCGTCEDDAYKFFGKPICSKCRKAVIKVINK